ncbi:MAG: hypothetical protein NVS2B3_13120 [Vulcanimicrobiaceae bacterium]
MPLFSRANALGAVTALVLASQAPTRFAGAAAKIDANDVKVLGRAIAFERAALKAYADAVATTGLSPRVIAALKGFSSDHQMQIDALVLAISQGGASAGSESANIATPTLSSEADVLSFIYTVERLGASTYLDTIAQFHNRDFATTAASILGVATTHVALLAEALKKTPAYPSGFVTA